jgi:hypothetical protein
MNKKEKTIEELEALTQQIINHLNQVGETNSNAFKERIGNPEGKD